jgi:hypothetical protein
MSITSLIEWDCYLIDCSSIMAFSGADYANPDRFKAYRQQIWNHLEQMILSDRLRTVTQVFPELEYNDPQSYNRLLPLRDRFVLPIDKQTDISVLNLISKYPGIIDSGQTYTREPADPFLIVYAKKLNIPIINEEKSLAERTGDRKHKRLMIPDVCQREGMTNQSIHLEELLRKEGVIP